MNGRELADRIDAALDGTPPGPWSWDGQNNSYVGTFLSNWEPGYGRCVVMDFRRLGMRAAQPMFRRPGPGHYLDLAVSDGLCVQEVDYRQDIVDVNNPTARLIAAAPALLAEARGVIRAQADEIAALRAELETLP